MYLKEEAVRDLGTRLSAEELNFTCDGATVKELRVVISVIFSNDIKRLKLVTNRVAPLVRHDLVTHHSILGVKDPVFSSYILERMCKAIGARVWNTLEELNLRRLPIGYWLNELKLEATKTLRKVSLERTRISDCGCLAMKESGLASSIQELDLTGCYITCIGIEYLVRLLKAQALRRSIDNGFKGLERIVINQNSVGNIGLFLLIDHLKNDVWIKSIELRSCFIEYVECVDDLLKCNDTIEILDLRNNPVHPECAIERITKALVEKHPVNTIKYEWMDPD